MLRKFGFFVVFFGLALPVLAADSPEGPSVRAVTVMGESTTCVTSASQVVWSIAQLSLAV